MTDPRAVESPEVLEALQVACASVRAATDASRLELCRLRIAQLLGVEAEASAPAWGSVAPGKIAALGQWPTSDAFDEYDRAALALAEQFVIDVGGVATGPLGPSAAVLGAEVGPLVQGLYLLDVGQRVQVVLGRLFDVTLTSGEWAWPDPDAVIPADPMDAIMAMMAAVGRLKAVDPVTKELVRLRGARLHRCRRCLSVRSVAALEAGATEELLDAADPNEVGPVDPSVQAALELVDATFLGRPALDDELRDRLRSGTTPGELAELVGYLLRNACNKISVAFAADAPIVVEGHELQVIDEAGETITVDA